MINILYIGIGPDSGGPIISLLHLLKSLDKTKFKPFILSLPNPHPYVFKELSQIEEVTILESNLWINNWLQSAYTKEKNSLWHKIKFPGRVIRSFYNSWHIAKLIRKNRIDIVHTNIELTIEGAMAAFLTGVPHVWHIRAPIGKSGAVKHFMGNKFCCALISILSAKIIVNSKATMKSVKGYINDDKLTLIYNGIDPEQFIFNNDNGALRQLLKIKNGDKIIASIGYLSKIKGGENFIKIATQICHLTDDIIFVWIGPSIERASDKFCNEVFKIVKLNKLGNRILFTGERYDINLLLKDVDLFLHPMLNGSWSRVVLEAMAESLPVIAIEEDLKSEIITNKETGILAQNDLEAVDSILKVIYNNNLLKEIGHKGKRRVITNFANNITTSKIMAVYNEIMMPFER